VKVVDERLERVADEGACSVEQRVVEDGHALRLALLLRGVTAQTVVDLLQDRVHLLRVQQVVEEEPLVGHGKC